jgi:hypothetical protein
MDLPGTDAVARLKRHARCDFSEEGAEFGRNVKANLDAVAIFQRRVGSRVGQAPEALGSLRLHQVLRYLQRGTPDLRLASDGEQEGASQTQLAAGWKAVDVIGAALGESKQLFTGIQVLRLAGGLVEMSKQDEGDARVVVDLLAASGIYVVEELCAGGYIGDERALGIHAEVEAPAVGLAPHHAHQQIAGAAGSLQMAGGEHGQASPGSADRFQYTGLTLQGVEAADGRLVAEQELGPGQRKIPASNAVQPLNQPGVGVCRPGVVERLDGFALGRAEIAFRGEVVFSYPVCQVQGLSIMSGQR